MPGWHSACQFNGEPADISPTAAQPSAVLGRISLVRKGGADARRNEQLARLLAFF
jgi:hypothetical protein